MRLSRSQCYGIAQLLLLGMLGISFGSPEALHSQSPDSAVFSGLTSVAVAVDIDEDLQRYVSAERLKTVIELELRRSGLQVIDIKSPAPRDGNLIFSLLALPDESSSGEVLGFSVARLVDFYQGATLVRNEKFAVVSTWTDHAVNYWGTSRVRQASESAARTAVDSFVNRYLANR